MKFNRFLAVLAVALLGGTIAAFGQVVTANLTGTVTMDNGPLPGVTVTIASPNMQGTRTTVTDVNGNYNFAAIPPGTYKVSFDMQGMTTVTRSVQVGVGQTGRADATMKLTTVAEAITVTASAPAVLETTEVQTNLQQQTVNKLPTSRTVTGVALLAPGTTSTGPRNALVISGATADQNLIMVDGANVQENLRGQAHNLFIEDAIQETTVLTGAISAEYGNFTGGVVNSITKSGGNEFHGTYRDNITNPAWTAPTAFPGDVPAPRKWNQSHEATLGGRIIRDRLWFFAAGRLAKTTALSAYGAGGNGVIQFPVATTEHRWEGKLTGQITPKHSMVVTYTTVPLKATNNCQLGCVELAGIDPQIQQANNFFTGHYNGILTNNWLIEALYSRKIFEFIGFGGDSRDPVTGTPLWAFSPTGSNLGMANAPYFCGVCGNEKRNNNDVQLRSTYFWSTKSLGTHNLVAGYERWAENRQSNNYQSPTNFVLVNYGGIARQPDGTALFNLVPDADYVEYFPILYPSLGSLLRTYSAYGNDKWDFNNHWSFNVGLRYDRNNSINSLHQKTSNDKNISPRLGANYDVFGNGKVRLTAGYNKYVGRLAETVSGASSPGGSPAEYDYIYEGPAVSGLTSHQAVQQFFNWFNSVGGTNNQDLIVYQNIPGFQVQLNGTLKTPSVREYTVGAGTQVGNGYFRADYIDRNWSNFYVNVIDTDTGQVTTAGVPADLTLVENTNQLKRTYRALDFQGQYRLFSSLNLGANYTFSRLRGNAVQENAGSGPISEGGWIFTYPEYSGFAQNNPVRYLPSDQTHKLRAWASYDLNTKAGNLNLSVMQRYDSGTPYYAVGAIDVRKSTAFPQGIANPGYVNPPTSVNYFFGNNVNRTQPLRSTDLSATYSFPAFRGAELYVEGYVFNTFNKQAITNLTSGASTVIATGVRTARNSGSGLTRFNPFTDTTLVQCPTGNTAAQCQAMGANWQLASNFGTPTSKAAYQQPRTYQMAFGVRF